jgi:hypothetical protein
VAAWTIAAILFTAYGIVQRYGSWKISGSRQITRAIGTALRTLGILGLGIRGHPLFVKRDRREYVGIWEYVDTHFMKREEK